MQGIEIEGLDLIDVLTQIDKKKNKFIAIMLNDLEMMYPATSNEYKMIRKVILDGMNDYTRSFMRVFFGDVEGLIMK
jgi:hypothetical protein